MYACMHACMHVYMYVCMYVCMCMWTTLSDIFCQNTELHLIKLSITPNVSFLYMIKIFLKMCDVTHVFTPLPLSQTSLVDL